MKNFKTLFFLLIITQLSVAQSGSLSVFDNLINRTWSAEGQWGDGTAFKQEITFKYGLDKHIILTEANGFTNEEQTQYGPRNHGIRKYDPETQSIQFWEFDVFGGLTEGSVSVEGKNMRYQYQYGDAFITDMWEYVDDNTYNFKVGNYKDGTWEEVYLNTRFKAASTKSLTEGQGDLPFRQIPDYPEKYTATTVAARMVEGLGFRFYWATEGLREQDLSYRPSPEGRTLGETVDHIYGMAMNVANVVKGKPSIGYPTDQPFAEKRKQVLMALKEASDILRSSKDKKMKDFNLLFQSGDRKTVFPFWNEINGPISDCLWHVGQVVSFRRSSGNPLPSGVNVLMGTKRE